MRDARSTFSSSALRAGLVPLVLLSGACRAPGAGEPEVQALRQASSAARTVVSDDEEPIAIGDAALWLARDRLGVVLTGSDAEALLLSELGEGAAVVERLPGWFLIVEVPSSSRDELAARARALEVALPDAVATAGQVVHEPGDGRPLLLGKRLRVAFADGADPAEARLTIEAMGGVVVWEDPDDPGSFVVDAVGEDAARFAERLGELPEVERTVARPVTPVVPYGPSAALPQDDRAPVPVAGPDWQWHHHNHGQYGGVSDADVDTPRAWSMETGSVPIAVIDDGFESTHADIPMSAVWSTAATPYASAVTAKPHGTSVAGLATALKDNAVPGSGTCPACPLIAVQYGVKSNDDQALAIEWAVERGARVINLSFGYGGNDVPEEVLEALKKASDEGVVVVAAMNNSSLVDDDTSPAGIPAASPEVVGVTGADQTDSGGAKAYGLCADVLGPVERFDSGALVGVATTDLTTGGFNPDPGNTVCAEDGDGRVTRCFVDNSAATPVVAGIAGLVVSAAEHGSPPLVLSPAEVERLLRDTADRVDPDAAGYRAIDGRSMVPHPSVAGTLTSTHGYGRANAYEAVRVVARTSVGGRGGVDAVLRDNVLDWGNTEQLSSHVFGPDGGFEPHWKSPDIKVDAPPYALGAGTVSAAQFEAFQDENPVSGEVNRVLVRVRNRGPRAATQVRVRASWAFAGAGLPALPVDYFSNPGFTSASWTSLGDAGLGEDLAYSGSSVAGTAADAARVVTFDFAAPALDPTAPDFRHYCILASVSAASDPVDPEWEARGITAPDEITPRDGNVTHRNLRLVDGTAAAGSAVMMLRLANPLGSREVFRLVPHLPRGVKTGGFALALEPEDAASGFELDPGRALDVEATVSWPAGFAGDIDLVQERRLEGGEFEPLGGFTVRVLPPPAPGTF